MRYLADDGTTFDTVKECKEYEAEIAEKEKQKKMQLEEKSRRYHEVEDAYNKYVELRDKYEDDYETAFNRLRCPSILEFLL